MNRLALVGLVMAGCTTSSRSAHIVRSVAIEGHALVVETCAVSAKHEMAVGNCARTSQPVPVFVVAADAPAPRPAAQLTFRLEREEIARGVATARAAVDACAEQHQATAPLQVRLVIDGGGQITAATTSIDNADLTACLAAALAPVRFTVESQSLVLTFKPGVK